MPRDVHLDFAVVLTLLTLVTGVFWALDKWWLGPKRRAALPADAADTPSGFIDFCRSFFPVIALVLLLRSFVAEPFRIPSGSMIPTLLVGDFILVNKFAYGLRDPVFHTRFLGSGKVERGDVVVFRWPVDPGTDFIKRIVGLPGDTIEYRDKQLFVNGEAAALAPDGVYPLTAAPSSLVVYRMTENLTGVEHRVLVNPDRPAEDFRFTVPAGQYFAMGDNRDGSADSRSWGTVPERNLVGKAFLIWLNLTVEWKGWIPVDASMDASRIGDAIH